jgi:hypothetical protein
MHETWHENLTTGLSAFLCYIGVRGAYCHGFWLLIPTQEINVRDEVFYSLVLFDLHTLCYSAAYSPRCPITFPGVNLHHLSPTSYSHGDVYFLTLPLNFILPCALRKPVLDFCFTHDVNPTPTVVTRIPYLKIPKNQLQCSMHLRDQ